MITPTHLTGFLLMHAGFRAEFGRLAQASAAPRDAAHTLLLEEQLELVLDLLHAHHTHEDDSLWPTLIARSPGSAEALAALEAEHGELDDLIAVVSDRDRPLPRRADTLLRLHDVVGAHLDHEEQVALPLMLEHLTPEDIEADKQRAMEDFGRSRVPVIFGWLASSADPELFAAANADLPLVARVLFRLFWWPSYRRRFARLYGAELPSLAAADAR